VWITAAGMMGALFLLRFSYFVFLDAADGHTGMLGTRLFNEITGALLAALLIVPLVLIARRLPLWQSWRRAIPLYAVLLVGFSLTHTLAMLAVRAAAAPLFGLSGYTFRLQPSRFAYEGVNDVLPFVAIFATFTLIEIFRDRRERERHAAALERSLLEAELRNLRLQLQPHFLFNALNTISSTMYDDPAEADALLGGLAELLRASLRSTDAHEVTAREELALLEQYLRLMHARFGDRLHVSVTSDPSAADLLVPSMVLQPLVENAVRHGAVANGDYGEVTVTVRIVGDMLELRVHDNGPGVREGAAKPGTGTGLSTTAQRLRLLYGDDHALTIGNAPEGGFAVTTRIPARRAPTLFSAIPLTAGAGA
jgi:signal transduction histidine kinase